MKSFIIFLALLLAGSSFMVYSADYQKLMVAEEDLKAAAEECASGAATEIDYNEYAEGRYTIDYNKAVEYVGKHAAHYIQRQCPYDVGKNTVNITVEDHRGTYTATLIDSVMAAEKTMSGREYRSRRARVTVEIILETEGDIMRLPYLKTDSRRISHSSTYETMGPE